MTDPIDHVRWIPLDAIRPNEYNPNAQTDAAHALLCASIRTDGWTQPLVVRPENEAGEHVIIDGEHRYLAAVEIGAASAPCVILDRDETACIAATVRHNRARGTHGVEQTAQLARMLREHGLDAPAICTALGLTPAELDRLETSEQAFLALMAGDDEVMRP